jgi:2-succinyl-5-enolpyruvyl-6-hydroxy-3-cyclohexene-1-carboxylate synthase
MTSPATLFARSFIGALIARGVTDVVVSPGSRSQALALAAAEAEQSGHLTLHVVVDERSAGFRALGIALETGLPAVALATSGSAPAHFLPAVMEAHHAGVPLIVVSADRPESLKGVGANQTTQHSGLFGFAATTIDAVAEANTAEGAGIAAALEVFDQAAAGGAAHVNIEFSEPLSSSEPSDFVLPTLPEPLATPGKTVSLVLEPEAGTLVIAGHRAGSRAEQWALELGAPLIAEVASGARFGPHLLPSYREVLNGEHFPTPLQRIITVGRPTLSREVWALLSDSSYRHIVIRGAEAEPANPSGQAHIVDSLDISHPATSDERSQWVKPWVIASREHHRAALEALQPQTPELGEGAADDPAARSAFAREQMEILRRAPTRQDVALSVWEASWPHDRLVLGASRMIREMDRIVGPKNIPVVSNRGLSGIDGTISAARGVAVAAPRSGATGVTRVVLGDLAFLHDAGSLMQEPGSSEGSKVHLFVANDGGGSIFDELEVGHSAPRELFDRVMFTPHTVDMSALATAYGWEYLHVTTMGELADALVSTATRLIVDISLER